MTILSLLTGQGRPELASDILSGFSPRFDTIILFLIDSFGWHFFEKYCDSHPFLQHFLHAGKVAKLTSEFPSTTTVHVTTINTGLPVAQAGLYEWYIYDPQVDALIEQARVTLDYLRRTALYRDAERLVMQEAPIISQHTNSANHLFQHWVRGAQTSRLGAIYLPYKNIWFEPTAHAARGTALARSGE